MCIRDRDHDPDRLHLVHGRVGRVQQAGVGVEAHVALDVTAQLPFEVVHGGIMGPSARALQLAAEEAITRRAARRKYASRGAARFLGPANPLSYNGHVVGTLPAECEAPEGMDP